MSKILELRTKRNTLWEQTKDFLEKNRGENGLVKADAVEQYNKMAQDLHKLICGDMKNSLNAHHFMHSSCFIRIL